MDKFSRSMLVGLDTPALMLARLGLALREQAESVNAVQQRNMFEHNRTAATYAGALFPLTDADMEHVIDRSLLRVHEALQNRDNGGKIMRLIAWGRLGQETADVFRGDFMLPHSDVVAPIAQVLALGARKMPAMNKAYLPGVFDLLLACSPSFLTGKDVGFRSVGFRKHEAAMVHRFAKQSWALLHDMNWKDNDE